MANSEGPVQVEQHSGTAGPSSARRKLIRGAFALPAVATLHSGSALANSSSLKCLAKLPSGSSAPVVIYAGATEPVSYLRIPLAVARAGQGSSQNFLYYVAGGDVFQAATARRVAVLPSLISLNGFRLFDVAQNIITGSEISQATVESNGYTLQDRGSLPNANRPFAALIFSADGNQIVGVGITGGENVNAATESCWTSFDTVA